MGDNSDCCFYRVGLRLLSFYTLYLALLLNFTCQLH